MTSLSTLLWKVQSKDQAMAASSADGHAARRGHANRITPPSGTPLNRRALAASGGILRAFLVFGVQCADW